MPNQPAGHLEAIYIRIPGELKTRLKKIADELNQANPGANYSMSSLITAAIEKEVIRLEKNLKK